VVRPTGASFVLLASALLAVSVVGTGGGSGVAAVASHPESRPDAGVAAREATTTTPSTRTAATTPPTTASGTTPPRDLETVLVARYPASNGSMVEERVLDASTVASAAPPTYDSRSDSWRVPVRLTDAGASSLATALVDAGFTSDGVADCPTTDARNDRGHCLLLVADGEVQTAFAVGERFAATVESGEFEADPRFVLVTANETAAKKVWRGLLDDAGTGSSTPTTQPTAASSAGTGSAASARGATTRAAGATPVGEEDETGPANGFGVAVAVAALVGAGVGFVRR